MLEEYEYSYRNRLACNKEKVEVVMENFSMSKLFIAFLLCGALLVVGCSKNNDTGTNSGYVGEQMTLDHVDGLSTDGNVQTGVPITFYIRLNNNTDDTISGFSLGFRVYSPDGAHWATTVGDTTGALGPAQFDVGVFFNPFSITGSGADTIGFGGFRILADGAPPGFDDNVFTIQVGPISESYHGKMICLDSCWYPPSNRWMWSLTGTKTIYPDWDGARCFRIMNPTTP